MFRFFRGFCFGVGGSFLVLGNAGAGMVALCRDRSGMGWDEIREADVVSFFFPSPSINFFEFIPTAMSRWFVFLLLSIPSFPS